MLLPLELFFKTSVFNAWILLRYTYSQQVAGEKTGGRVSTVVSKIPYTLKEVPCYFIILNTLYSLGFVIQARGQQSTKTASKCTRDFTGVVRKTSGEIQ